MSDCLFVASMCGWYTGGQFCTHYEAHLSVTTTQWRVWHRYFLSDMLDDWAGISTQNSSHRQPILMQLTTSVVSKHANACPDLISSCWQKILVWPIIPFWIQRAFKNPYTLISVWIYHLRSTSNDIWNRPFLWELTLLMWCKYFFEQILQKYLVAFIVEGFGTMLGCKSPMSRICFYWTALLTTLWTWRIQLEWSCTGSRMTCVLFVTSLLLVDTPFLTRVNGETLNLHLYTLSVNI